MSNNDTPEKARYAAPILRVYGHFAALTAAGSNTGREGSGVGNGARRP